LTEIEEIFVGWIADFLSDWESGYRISEDLPVVAEELTKLILKSLEDFGYIIIKDDLLGKLI
jgi:hypothetical protein